MTSGNDDFWGNESNWTDRVRAQPTTRVPRIDAASGRRPGDADPATDHNVVRWNEPSERPVQRLKRGWSKLLGTGANPTREHGIVRPDASRTAAAPTDPHGVSADMFDDLDDFDFTSGQAYAAPEATTDASAAPSALNRQPNHAPNDVDGLDEWDAELAPVPVTHDRSMSSAGIDPLLFRVGVVALIAALLVPLLIRLGSDDTASLVESAPIDASAPSTLGLLPVSTEPTTTSAAPTRSLDPDDLPPAVPVNGAPAVAESLQDDAAVAAQVAEPVAAPPVTDASTAASTTAAPTTEAPAIDAASGRETSDNDSVGSAAEADAPADRVERNCAIDYEVVAGDFWIRIADGAGVPLAELLEANGASESTPIYPGISICLPAGSTTPAPPTTAPPTTTPVTTAPPTTTPATTTPPTTTPPGTDATPEEVQQIIRDVWPDELEERALEIAFRESRYVPTAKNFCCYGIFQIYWSVHRSWLGDIGITNDQQLYDPATNARAAYALYQRAGGWGPWSL